MKIFSDNAVTKSDIDSINEKQDRQIKQLRIAIAVATVFNVLFTVGLKFFA